ncbi:hypothetical protein H012_gp181 [Acanthamoeba polyphaga moumouvirus]|uniref:Uncharacterized protein n=1 Tax=Acanthamoeba polyphaga moumouvirus TaxID=1269028 RepID=L7RGN2_9VIRU|nr:hypothetical protein H012_gp181 [Acanthamoeba polyphaga moumouvirus]AGC02270.1 hypothetical protein Moumou_00751 [Acanthamoeba polyphaga moumouvirus]
MGNFSSSDKNLSDIENEKLREVIDKAVISLDHYQYYHQIAVCFRSKRVRNTILDIVKHIFQTHNCNEYSLTTEIKNIDNEPILYVYTVFYRKTKCVKRIRMSFRVCRDLQDIVFKFNTY